MYYYFEEFFKRGTMKKKLCILFTVLFLFSAIPAKSVDIKEKLSQIGFNLFTEKDAASEITKVIEKQQKYANKNNYKKLKLLYTDDYTNFDGINIDEYVESLQKTWNTHDKLSYKTTINSINVFGNYATVYVTDEMQGQTKDTYEKIEGKGVLSSTAKSVYYFKKDSGEWKINSDMTISEKTSLKYGSTKNMEIEIDAPECVGADTQYEVKVVVNSDEKSAIIASITSEPIQYPQIKSEDVFRTLKRDGELERVVTSNNNGKNEVAFASIAIAKPLLKDSGEIEAAVEGVAFVATRINVIPKKAVKNE